MRALDATIATKLDVLRCAALRLSFGLPVVRRLFATRGERLFFGHTLVCGAAASVAFVSPWTLLAFGPFFYGFPHLFASLRYAVPKAILARVACVAGLFALARLAMFLGLLPAIRGNGLELGLCAGLLCVWKPTWRHALVLAPFAAVSLWRPSATVEAMILVHNAVAYLHWHRLATEPRERRVALAAFGGFLALSVALFAGAGFLATYAFGQAAHYFVWLKAIPEQNLPRPSPVTFRQSLGFLRRDFGPRGARLVLGGVCGLTLLWVLVEAPLARSVYFCLAAWHGYVEIYGLLAGRRSL